MLYALAIGQWRGRGQVAEPPLGRAARWQEPAPQRAARAPARAVRSPSPLAVHRCGTALGMRAATLKGEPLMRSPPSRIVSSYLPYLPLAPSRYEHSYLVRVRARVRARARARARVRARVRARAVFGLGLGLGSGSGSGFGLSLGFGLGLGLGSG